MSLQELLRERGAREIREEQIVADVRRRLREVWILAHFLDGARSNQQRHVGQVADAHFLVAQGVVDHGRHGAAFAH